MEPVELEELSSSEPTIFLAVTPLALLALAEAANMFLNAWKKIEEIREIRGRLKKVAIEGAAATELDERITTIVDDVVEESVTKVSLSIA